MLLVPYISAVSTGEPLMIPESISAIFFNLRNLHFLLTYLLCLWHQEGRCGICIEIGANKWVECCGKIIEMKSCQCKNGHCAILVAYVLLVDWSMLFLSCLEAARLHTHKNPN